MWEPVGPLPASVYWRRRGSAVAAAVALLVLSTWGVASLVTPARPVAAPPTVRGVVLSAPQQDPPPPVATPGAADPAAGSATTAASTPPATPTPSATPDELRPDDAPRGSVPVATPVPVPPTGPVPCTNQMVTVSAEAEHPSYRVGQHPVLRLVITNSSGQPCVRDLDSARQEIVVWSGDGATRLWSSNDCSNAHGVDLRTLVPGQPVVSAVTWAGRTSQPKCAGERTVIPAGAYRVVTRLDDDISAPVPILLTS